MDRVAQFDAFPEVGDVLSAVDDLTMGEIAVRQPDEAVDFAVGNFVAELVALGVGDVGVDGYGIARGLGLRSAWFRLGLRSDVAFGERSIQLLLDGFGDLRIIGNQYDDSGDARFHVPEKCRYQDGRGHE